MNRSSRAECAAMRTLPDPHSRAIQDPPYGGILVPLDATS